MSSRSNKPAREAGAFPTTDQLLSAIDAVLRRGALPEALAAQLKPESPAASAAVANLHHPDADCVLRRCRERHPEWTEFPERTVRAVVYHLLHDCAAMALMARLCAEDPNVVERVRGRLAALSPDRSDDDLWWVWHELARRYPAARDYDYSDRQIRKAWLRVRSLRGRYDHIGVGGPRPEARRRRRVALAALAAELARPAKELLRLDTDDYDPADGTLSFTSGGCRVIARLSPPVRRKVDKWLKLRGSKRGGLFELPRLAVYWEAPASPILCVLDRAGRASAGTLEEEDYVESLCDARDALGCAFVLANLSDHGGDWSPGFIERLRASSGAMAEHDLTRYERRKCRQRLRDLLTARPEM